MRAQPLIGVKDVRASSAWYQRVLGCPSDMEAGHAHREEFDRLVGEDGKVILMLHSWGAETDGPMDRMLVEPDRGPHGFGVFLSFATDDFDGAVDRARSLGAEFVSDIYTNPDRTRNVILRDADGYSVVLSSTV